jgi:hypothetical protein
MSPIFGTGSFFCGGAGGGVSEEEEEDDDDDDDRSVAGRRLDSCEERTSER